MPNGLQNLIERQTFGVSRSGGQNPFELSVSVNGESGDIDIVVHSDITTELETITGTGILRPGGTTIDASDLKIEVRPNSNDLSSLINTLSNNNVSTLISNQFNIPVNQMRFFIEQSLGGLPLNNQFLDSNLQDNLPSDDLDSNLQDNLPSDDLLKFSQDIESFPSRIEFEVPNFPPPPVPEELLDTIPGVRIRVDLSARSFIEDIRSSILGDFPSITIRIPPEAFVSTFSFNQVPCGDLFSDLDNRITQISNRINDAASRIEGDFSSLRSIDQELPDQQFGNVLGDITQSLDGSRLRELNNRFENLTSPQALNVQDIAENELQNLQDQIQLPRCLNQFDLDELRDKLQRVKEYISLWNNVANILDVDIPAGDCLQRTDEFGSIIRELNELESDARDVTSGEIRTINSIRNDLNDLRDDIDSQRVREAGCLAAFMQEIVNIRDLLPTGEVDCTTDDGMPRSVRNAWDEFDSNARAFRDLERFERTQSKFDRLMNRADQIEGNIRQRGETRNCIEFWLDRLERSKSLINNAGAVRRSRIPCDFVAPDLNDEISEFESRVFNLSAPVDTETIQEISREGQSIINDIEAADDLTTDCQDQFVTRVRSAVDRVDSLTERVRIVRGRVPSEERQEREELLKSLRQAIERIAIQRPQFEFDQDVLQ